MNRNLIIFLTLIIFVSACAPASIPAPGPVSATQEPTFPAAATATPSPPTETFTPSPVPPTETPSPTPASTAIPTVESFKAKVSADKIVCRYGPGANYLYLIAFNQSTPIRLIGRTEGRNDWVLIENGQQDCWVNAQYLDISEGDPKTLPVMYPNGYKIPVSPYYGPTTVLSATRAGDEITVTWMEVIVSPGKYENEAMFPYLIEIWYCKGGEIIFDTLGSRVPFITFTDEAGCAEPSRGRVYIQEKHGYAGPAEIPWPER
ncbi:MAG: hypothetical protein HXY38_14855 [Chloroflexi bacterium]|nr:hypothetical protein [Chloroflexota bacterium]